MVYAHKRFDVKLKNCVFLLFHMMLCYNGRLLKIYQHVSFFSMFLVSADKDKTNFHLIFLFTTK